MKKTLSICLTIAIIFTLSSAVSAVNGDIAGYIYSTDILAYVNDRPVESYNLGRKTAQEVAVMIVSWKGETTVYIYPRDFKL